MLVCVKYPELQCLNLEVFAQHDYIKDWAEVEAYVEFPVTNELRDDWPQQHEY